MNLSFMFRYHEAKLKLCANIYDNGNRLFHKTGPEELRHLGSFEELQVANFHGNLIENLCISYALCVNNHHQNKSKNEIKSLICQREEFKETKVLSNIFKG